MNQISDFKASSLILHGCSATQSNVLIKNLSYDNEPQSVTHLTN